MLVFPFSFLLFVSENVVTSEASISGVLTRRNAGFLSAGGKCASHRTRWGEGEGGEPWDMIWEIEKKIIDAQNRVLFFEFPLT